MTTPLKRYFILNKPYNMVSQFKSSHSVKLLGAIDFDFPENTHAIGRLDINSEGLLLLTTDKTVTRKLFLASKPHERTYLMMVQNKMTEATLHKLKTGIYIPTKNNELYLAKPVNVSIVQQPTLLYKFATDYREIYPHTWISITLIEGKFRQVRKMAMAVKHRCLRLIRISIADICLDNLSPGQVMEIDESEFYSKINS